MSIRGCHKFQFFFLTRNVKYAGPVTGVAYCIVVAQLTKFLDGFVVLVDVIQSKLPLFCCTVYALTVAERSFF